MLLNKEKYTNYFDEYSTFYNYYFKTKLNRKYYLLFLLIMMLSLVVIALLSLAPTLQNASNLIFSIWLISLISASVRRLHDLDLKGYFLFFILLVPIASWYYLFRLLFGKSVRNDRFLDSKQNLGNSFFFDREFKYSESTKVKQKTKLFWGILCNALLVGFLLYVNFIFAVTVFIVLNYLMIAQNGLFLGMFLAIIVPVAVTGTLFYKKKVRRPFFALINTILWIACYFSSFALISV